jgi:hypothetical protein
MFSITPIVSIIANIATSALTGIWATQVTDSTGIKTSLGGIAVATLINAILHSFSSASPGPLASTPPKA